MFTNCCLRCLRTVVLRTVFTNCCLRSAVLRTAVLRTAVYELLFYELLIYELLFYELLFYDLLFYELDFSTTVQLPQPTVTAMTVIPLTNNHCTFALLTNHYFNYHYQRLLIATPQLSSLLLHIKKSLQFWRCHE